MTLARPPGFLRTSARMFRRLRAERIDLLVPLSFSLIAGVFADFVFRKALEVISPRWTSAYAASLPEVRPWVAGILVAAGFWIIGLRPYWLLARRELVADGNDGRGT